MQNDRRSSVRIVLPRMLIKFSFIMMIVMMAGGYYTYSQVLDKMRMLENDNIQAITEGTVAGISNMIVARDYSHLQETLRQSMDNQNITSLAVTDLDGRVLSEMVRIGRVPEAVFNDAKMMIPINNDDAVITRDGNIITVWQRVDSLVHVGWLKLTLNTEHYDSIIKNLINSIILTIGIMLLIMIATILYQYMNSYRQLSFHETRLMNAAHTDVLTGLPNRLMLNYYLNRGASRANKTKKSFSVAFLDLDGFKQVNDQYGHAVGDKLLIEVSQRLRSTLRDDDHIVRLGGDEFVIILNEVDRNTTEHLLERVMSAINESYQLSDKINAQVTASIGVSTYEQTKDTDMLLINADTAMYRAKATGKNTIVFSE